MWNEFAREKTNEEWRRETVGVVEAAIDAKRQEYPQVDVAVSPQWGIRFVCSWMRVPPRRRWSSGVNGRADPGRRAGLGVARRTAPRAVPGRYRPRRHGRVVTCSASHLDGRGWLMSPKS